MWDRRRPARKGEKGELTRTQSYINQVVGTKGHSGGAREGAGSGGAREGAGRPKGAIDVMPREAKQEQRWRFAEYAVQHAYEALNVLIDVMRATPSCRERHVPRLLTRSSFALSAKLRCAST